MISDEIGAVEQTNFFDPWGRERKIVTSGSIKQWLANNDNYRIANKPITTRGFTGHEQLAEVGLIHMNGRIYDGALGRFVQADPIIQDPLRVQSLNRYSYVWNNPLNATDPSGFMCDQATGGIGCETVEREKTEEQEKEKKTDKPTDSGLKYKITDKKALEDWLKKNGKTMEDFTKAMEDKGISKAGFGDSGSTIGGVFVGKKGQTQVRSVANQSGSNSGAANETNFSPWVDSASPFAGRTACGSDRQCVQQNDEFQNEALTWTASAMPGLGMEFLGVKLLAWFKKAETVEDALQVTSKTTAIGRMDDLKRFDADDAIDTWHKTGPGPLPGNTRITWQQNQKWLQERIDRGDDFIIATDPFSLPNPKNGYIPGKPNGFFTARELEYLNKQGIKPKYKP